MHYTKQPKPAKPVLSAELERAMQRAVLETATTRFLVRLERERQKVLIARCTNSKTED